MKLFIVSSLALASGESTNEWGDDVNAEACIYNEVDGVTTITTVEELTAATKCYKKFSCDDGRNVMAKVNEMYLGSFGVGDQMCNENFVKFEYRVPREGDTDYPIEDKFCDKSHPLELGEWRTMDDHVWFSFEFTDWDYYDWFYGYNDYLGNEVERNPKFEIEFKCSEPVEPEPSTTSEPTNECWELGENGELVPAAGMISTVCGSNSISMSIAACVIDTPYISNRKDMIYEVFNFFKMLAILKLKNSI